MKRTKMISRGTAWTCTIRITALRGARALNNAYANSYDQTNYRSRDDATPITNPVVRSDADISMSQSRFGLDQTPWASRCTTRHRKGE